MLTQKFVFYYLDDLSEFNILIETLHKERLNDNNDEVLENNENDSNIFGEKKLTGLSLWTTFQVWQTNQTNSVVSWQWQENLATLVCTSSTSFICLNEFDRWYFLKQKLLIFSPLPYNLLKILTNSCDRETINNILARDLWINRLYFSLSLHKNSCLTIDFRK